MVLHQITARQMSIKAVGLFRFELSLETLLKVCSISKLTILMNIFFKTKPEYIADTEDHIFDNNAY